MPGTVLNKDAQGALQPALPQRVALGFAKPNQLLVFSGDLLHCVCHAPPGFAPATDDAPRRTLLMNWWARRPAGAVREGVPRSLLPSSVEAPAAAMQQVAAPKTSAAVRVSAACSFEDHVAEWRRQVVPTGLLRSLPPSTTFAWVAYPDEAARPRGAQDWPES